MRTQLETLTTPADDRDTTGEIIPADHGTDGTLLLFSLDWCVDYIIALCTGPVRISLTGYTEGTDSLVLNTSAELSSEFPYNEDVNSGDSIGISTSTALFCNFTARSLKLFQVGRSGTYAFFTFLWLQMRVIVNEYML